MASIILLHKAITISVFFFSFFRNRIFVYLLQSICRILTFINNYKWYILYVYIIFCLGSSCHFIRVLNVILNSSKVLNILNGITQVLIIIFLGKEIMESLYSLSIKLQKAVIFTKCEFQRKTPLWLGFKCSIMCKFIHLGTFYCDINAYED